MNLDRPVPPIVTHEIQLWTLNLVHKVEALPGLRSVLSVDEQTRANRFHRPVDRQYFMIVHALTRLVLAAHLKTRPQDLVFQIGPFGKPRVWGSGLEFNLSRSRGFALLAVAWDRQVGVDLEFVQCLPELDLIAAQRFSEDERRELSAAGEQRRDLFFTFWTRHEALLKACGMGLSHHKVCQAGTWSYRNMDVIKGYSAAVAAQGSDWFVTLQNG
ncbi:hypothetical protein DKM44_02440 [Deinococcus irradiatisoli]|uniref:4'-phosphopantetheinyl transferase domain-containing protein n=1 Tax=Deinococcus irradiatisoli TaxID=2202254 RepID=A0A2Z3JBA9_9DEIO|nr:4'-phosphopantetheinyl transferase superfamily protein [Deinococcus irradiatisoli]AWN22235.1 hypothetical protein DKM44_02440 [Deinococcus irradiatisoli]